MGQTIKRPRNTDTLVGAIFERADGSRFTIEKQDGKYVYYWLSAGSRPQFRSIAIERLLGPARNYRRVPGANRKSLDG